MNGGSLQPVQPVEAWDEPEEPAESAISEGLFTRYVRAHEPGAEPPPELARAMWSAFKRLVRRELGRRSLSGSAPEWLGVYGFRGGWDEGGRGGPLEELAAECYRFVFVERFASLKAQAHATHPGAKPSIDGVVVASVRNFFHSQGRRHDRLGARLFEVLCQAARRAVARGELVVLSGPKEIRSATVLATPRPASGGPPAAAGLASRELLAELARRWNDRLLPELITATRAEKGHLVDELARLLGELDLSGVAAFRFGDLLAPLKADVRGRWAALIEGGVDGPADEEAASGLRPLRQCFEPSVEDRLIATDRFARLMDCADAAITADPGSARTRLYLTRLLMYFRASSEHENALPSSRRLGEHLKIPRERLAGLIATLKGTVGRCRAQLDEETTRFLSGARPSEPRGSWEEPR